MLTSLRTHPGLPATTAACLLLAGCGGLAAVQATGSILDIALRAGGLTSRTAGGRPPSETQLRIHAGEQLNTSREGHPLSLVVRIYALRSAERLKAISYEQLTSPEGEREGLGDDLISTHEVILLPGKTHTVPFRSSLPETTTIGVAGLFRSPYAERWKLAFAADAASEIVIGAHACALTTSSATQIPEAGNKPASSLVGVQCNR